MLKKDLKILKRKKLSGKAPFIRKLVSSFISKANHNFMVSSILLKLGDSNEQKKMLKLPEDFSAYDWVVITAYYAMYHSALAALASIGYKSDNHTATILALEVFFVRKNLLEKEFLDKLKEARELEEEYIQKFRMARRQRETAQYGVTKETGKNAAERLLKDARKFVNRMEQLVGDLERSGVGGC
ncbi:MAG: HEPN domain-containing protein [Candidatus Diapherotrites archaeon]|nr:HEPN domain-containing protein [Candidatus Diapherotrites archaeon]